MTGFSEEKTWTGKITACRAGHTVRLTGEINADGKAITVSNVAMAGEKVKK